MSKCLSVSLLTKILSNDFLDDPQYAFSTIFYTGQMLGYQFSIPVRMIYLKQLQNLDFLSLELCALKNLTFFNRLGCDLGIKRSPSIYRFHIYFLESPICACE